MSDLKTDWKMQTGAMEWFTGPRRPIPPHSHDTSTNTPASTPAVDLTKISNLPVFQQLRSGKLNNQIFDFGFKFERPGNNFAEIPNPFQAASTFRRLPSDQQADYLRILQSQFAITEEQARNMMNSATPGFRRFGGQALQF